MTFHTINGGRVQTSESHDVNFSKEFVRHSSDLMHYKKPLKNTDLFATILTNYVVYDDGTNLKFYDRVTPSQFILPIIECSDGVFAGFMKKPKEFGPGNVLLSGRAKEQVDHIVLDSPLGRVGVEKKKTYHITTTKTGTIVIQRLPTFQSHQVMQIYNQMTFVNLRTLTTSNLDWFIATQLEDLLLPDTSIPVVKSLFTKFLQPERPFVSAEMGLMTFVAVSISVLFYMSLKVTGSNQ